MTSDNFLFLFVVSLIAFTLYSICTCKVTAEEKQEMLDSDEMWP